ncbi:MAG: gliding motility-associated C-terminal domain-containing protein [Saprospiraceae bacterium]|nr:gliding motility-associated C-terminal domain-containing protein [Candidatus Vicinibacter affinis]MBK8644689.1 gliding motility-associated C-terminal domain-containing protein [Candidatus Vicinibacter affinis]MBP6173431.1 gliding motility-associated C-terminal domain-containing protein [Saprospiraceae bacterium]MBP6523219.1 gliding motility-associated C-terminal domain-containing protein [Saprospiraceae bacterium]
MRLKFSTILSLAILTIGRITLLSSQCTGIDADAGPDLFTCDPNDPITLQGNVMGNYTKFSWSPTSGLSDPMILDPQVTHKNPGIYKYKLSAEGVGATNLIINGNFEAGNTGFSTSYIYGVPGSPFGPNNYGVGDNPQAYNGGFSPCGDHTSGSGQQMVVDGSTTPGSNVWCQTVAVTPGNSYLVEFYVQNVYPVSPSVLNLKVNGATIGSGVAGALCDWIRIEGCFTASSGSANICITEASGVGFGNDFAIDDIAMFEKCMDMDEVTVEIVDVIAKLTIPFKPKCSSETFDLFATGSSFGPNVSYEWSTDVGKIISQNGLMAKAKGSGIYTVKVKYKNGTVECEEEASIEYIAPDELVGFVDADGRIDCQKDSVQLIANLTSGSGIYSYKWSPDSNLIDGQNTEIVLVKKAGKYTVTITDQTSGCTLLIDYDVKADTVRPIAGITGDSLLNCKKQLFTLNSTILDSTKYFLSWTHPDLTITNQKLTLAGNLPGKYKLSILDKNNHCEDSVNWDVKIDTLAPLIELGSNLSIDCKNNGVNVTNNSSNPSGNYSYFWSVDTTKFPKENVLSDKLIVKSGLVILKLVNDINGCESSDSLTVLDSRMVPLLDAGKNEILTCKTSSFKLNATVNSNDSLDITWTSVGGNIVSGSNRVDPTINQKGWYYIRIKNRANDCENLDSLFVDQNILKPIVSAGSDQIFSCVDTLKTIDGSSSSSGSQFSFRWTSPDGIIKSGNGTNKIEVRTPGTYILVVTDTINGCQDSSSVKITPDLNKPIVSIKSPDTLNCNKLDIDLTATANSQSGNQLSYEWSSQGGGTIQSPNALQTKINAPGTYIFKATDQSNGCSASFSVSVAIDTVKPMVNAGKDLIWNCESQQLTLSGTASGNSNSFSFNWTSTGGQIQGNSGSKNITVVSPGTYTVTVKDLINGCESSDMLSIIPDLTKPIVNIQTPDTLNCKRSILNINAGSSSNGNRYLTSWQSNGGNILGSPSNLNISVDKAGVYVLTIKDTVNKCVSLDSIRVFEDFNKPTINFPVIGEITCSKKDILIQGIVQNQGKNFQLIWNTTNGSIIGATDKTDCLAGSKGTYYLKVKNLDNGCETTDSISVLENTNVPTLLNYDLEQARCTGENASLTLVNIVGGVQPYTYFLDNIPVAGPYISGLQPGRRTIRVVDANGCILNSDFIVTIPDPVGVSLPPVIKINEGDPLVLQAVIITPKDSIDWIKWDPVDNLSCSDCANPSVTNLQKETTYTVTYANKEGCIASASITIQIIKKGIWIPSVFSPNGDGINDWFFPSVTEDSYKTIRKFSIFSRWGERIFDKVNIQPNIPGEGWNGEFKNEPLNPGVFIYVLEIEWNDGKVQQLTGDINLLR